jgi:hypothetical protein
MSESLVYKGSLEGHGGWVTAIATSSENPDMILTASRGASSGVEMECIGGKEWARGRRNGMEEEVGYDGIEVWEQDDRAGRRERH